MSIYEVYNFSKLKLRIRLVTLTIICQLYPLHPVMSADSRTWPIALFFIMQVLKYARKKQTNKYPRNRSALTYCEEDYPSRLDLGKDKYGGPFSEEQVEDVGVDFRRNDFFTSRENFTVHFMFSQ